MGRFDCTCIGVFRCNWKIWTLISSLNNTLSLVLLQNKEAEINKTHLRSQCRRKTYQYNTWIHLNQGIKPDICWKRWGLQNEMFLLLHRVVIKVIRAQTHADAGGTPRYSWDISEVGVKHQSINRQMQVADKETMSLGVIGCSYRKPDRGALWVTSLEKTKFSVRKIYLLKIPKYSRCIITTTKTNRLTVSYQPDSFQAPFLSNDSQ